VRDRRDTRLAFMGARLDRLEASVDRLHGSLGRLRRLRRLFMRRFAGLTVEPGLSMWVLWRSHARTRSSGGDHETLPSAIREFSRLSDDHP
jgi:hypothetical protein